MVLLHAHGLSFMILGLVFGLLGASCNLVRAHRPQPQGDLSEVVRWRLQPSGSFVQVKASEDPELVARAVNDRVDKLEQRVNALSADLEETLQKNAESAAGNDEDDEETDEGPDVDIDSGQTTTKNETHGAGGDKGHQGHAHVQKSFLDVEKWTPDESHMVSSATAFLLMFFVAFIMCVVYLLNFPDEQVHSLSYKLLSAVLAILCAVLVEKAQFGKFSNLVIIGMILGDDMHHVKDEFELMCVNMVFFLGWVFALSVALKRNSHSHENMYAIRTFVAHEVAFVGIHMFAGPQLRVAGNLHGVGCSSLLVKFAHGGFVLGVAIFCAVCSLAGQFMRSSHVARPLPAPAAPDAVKEGKEEAIPGEHREGHKEHERDGHCNDHFAEAWKAEASEGEDEAAAILLSFLTRQTIVLLITGRVPTVKGDFGEHTPGHFASLFGTILVVFTLLLLVSKLSPHSDGHHVPSAAERSAEFVVQYLAFLVGWMTLSICRWCMQRIVHEKTLMFVGVAGWVSFPLLMAIILFDFLCDEGWLMESTALIFIECSGLVIGISWEKAFAMAIDTINHSHSGSTSAFVVTEMCLCVGLCAMLLPGWRMYIIPVASRPVPPRHGHKHGHQHVAALPSVRQCVHEDSEGALSSRDRDAEPGLDEAPAVHEQAGQGPRGAAAAHGH